MVKVLVVFGTRPEAIKMAPLIHSLYKKFNLKVCVTAQHREMLDQVLELFQINPDYDLNIMKSDQDLFDVMSQAMFGIKSVISKENPDIVLVHGDTTTSMAAAMSAFYLKVPVGHVEAGLRTYNLNSPYPEEFNRQVTSRIASLHFAPTQIACQNLLDEKVPKDSIFITGNTVVDALLSVVKKARKAFFSEKLINKIPFLINERDFLPKIILVTGHRRENFGVGFEEICKALREIALSNPKVQIIYPVHLNPNVREPVNRILSHIDNVHLAQPLAYLDFIKLMDLSYLILTDSGGVQEEAPSLGKPVLVMRDNTERPEAVNAGTVKLVGKNKILISKAVSELLDNKEIYKDMSRSHNPYGDGNSSKLICDILDSWCAS